jgi:hypothetical protein
MEPERGIFEIEVDSEFEVVKKIIKIPYENILKIYDKEDNNRSRVDSYLVREEKIVRV